MVSWVILFAIPLLALAVNKDKVVVAINCGSPNSFKDASDVIYSEDKHFRGGVESDLGTKFADQWPDFPDIELYQTERYTNQEALLYKLPLSKVNVDGHYVLVLKFSEVYFDSPYKKVFGINLGTKQIISDVDIFGKVGKYAPYDEYVEFDIRNRIVYVGNEAVESAFSQTDSTLMVSFVRGRQDNPKINAILLVKGTLKDTDYESYTEYLKNKEKLALEKQEKLQQKRAQEIEHLLESDDDLDLSTIGQRKEKSPFTVIHPKNDFLKESINSFLLIPYGLEALSAIIVILIFVSLTFLGKKKETHPEQEKKKDE